MTQNIQEIWDTIKAPKTKNNRYRERIRNTTQRPGRCFQQNHRKKFPNLKKLKKEMPINVQEASEHQTVWIIKQNPLTT